MSYWHFIQLWTIAIMVSNPQSSVPPRAKPLMLGRRDRGADEGDEQNTGRQAGGGTEPRYATNAKINNGIFMAYKHIT